MDWNFKPTDPGSKFKITFANGEGTITTPPHWVTNMYFRDLQKDAIVEEWGLEKIQFKYPSENTVSVSSTTNLNQLEMQFVHNKKKPAKA